MKRIFISLICFFLSFASLFAQNYSELDLIGEWNVIEGTGVMGLETLSVNNLSAIHGNYSNQDGGTFKTKTLGDYSIKDIFITSGNIMHIYIVPSSNSTSPTLSRVRIIIKSLESGVLTLSSLDGNSNFTLKKKETTDVASIKAKNTKNNDYYDLQGMKTTNLSKHEVYIHNGKKYINK